MDLYQELESEYLKSIASLEGQLTKLRQSAEILNESLCSCELSRKDAEEVLGQMELEFRSMPGRNNAEMQSRLASHKSRMRSVKESISQIRDRYQKAQLMGADSSRRAQIIESQERYALILLDFCLIYAC
jgi:hypothetical protein